MSKKKSDRKAKSKRKSKSKSKPKKTTAKAKSQAKKSSAKSQAKKSSAKSKAEPAAAAEAEAKTNAIAAEAAAPAPNEAAFQSVQVAATSVRLNLPAGWHIENHPATLAAFNATPPHNHCRFDLSVQRLPGMAGMIPVKGLLLQALGGQAGVRITEVQRPDMKLAKAEVSFVDPRLGPARTRTALAVSQGLWILMAFNFWEKDLAWAHPAWVAATQSLQVSRN